MTLLKSEYDKDKNLRSLAEVESFEFQFNTNWLNYIGSKISKSRNLIQRHRKGKTIETTYQCDVKLLV